MAQNEIEAMEEFVDHGYFTCPKCDNPLEIDADKCSCGWANEYQL